MLLRDFISRSSEGLESLYGPEEAKAIVLHLCSEQLGTKSYTHIVDRDYEIDSHRLPGLEAAMARLKEGEPLQYVLGYADFYGFRFHVGPEVLIPRPETEQLCRLAVQEASRISRMRSAFGGKEVKVLDLCTGSGCIAWTMALSVPGVTAVGVDISAAALSVASGQDFKAVMKKSQAKAPFFAEADVLAGRGQEKSVETVLSGFLPFDIVISNPPYVRESEKQQMRRNVCDYEPSSALFVPDSDPLVFYRAISEMLPGIMTKEGTGFVEINEAFGEETADIFRSAGFSCTSLVKDFCSKDRIVKFSK